MRQLVSRNTDLKLWHVAMSMILLTAVFFACFLLSNWSDDTPVTSKPNETGDAASHKPPPNKLRLEILGITETELPKPRHTIDRRSTSRSNGKLAELILKLTAELKQPIGVDFVTKDEALFFKEKEIPVRAIEATPTVREDEQTLKPYELGFADPDTTERAAETYTEALFLADEIGADIVIVYLGKTPKDFGREQLLHHSSASFEEHIIATAKTFGIPLALMQIHSKDDTTGYVAGKSGGDSVSLCLDIVKKVDSPWLGLAFSSYDVQMMGEELGYEQTAECLRHTVYRYTGGTSSAGKGPIHEGEQRDYHVGLAHIARSVGVKPSTPWCHGLRDDDTTYRAGIVRAVTVCDLKSELPANPPSPPDAAR